MVTTPHSHIIDSYLLTGFSLHYGPQVEGLLMLFLHGFPGSGIPGGTRVCLPVTLPVLPWIERLQRKVINPKG